MEEETKYSEIRIWENTQRDYRQYDHEPSIVVHNVFSQAIPGAFGIESFRKLIKASEDINKKE